MPFQGDKPVQDRQLKHLKVREARHCSFRCSVNLDKRL